MRQPKRITPIGIHVRSGVVYAIQYLRQNGHLRQIAAATEPLDTALPGIDPLLPALQRLMTSNNFNSRKAVLALPSADVEIRPLRLPPGIKPGGPGFEQALLSEARSCLLYDPAEAVLDYLPFATETMDADQRQMLLLIASRRERVNRFLAVFKEAGLQCDHLEVAACAAARVLQQAEGYYAIVDLDRQQTVISVAEGHRMLFSRTIKSGCGEWVSRVSQALEVSERAAQDLLQDMGIAQGRNLQIDLDTAADTGVVQSDILPAVLYDVCSRSLEQLLKEIRRTTDYFALLPGGGRVERVFLLGELFPKGIDAMLEERLHVKVQIGGTLAEGKSSEFSARWTIAQGLALRGDK